MSVLLRLLAVAMLWVFATAAHAATTAEIDQARNKGLAWLFTHQNGDGSWKSASGLQMQPTTAAVEAFLNSGITRGGGYSRAASWLLNAEVSSTDSLARQIITLEKIKSYLTDIDTGSLKARLALTAPSASYADQYQRVACWGAYDKYECSYPDTSLGARAVGGGSYGTLIYYSWYLLQGMLRDTQKTDGGWPYSLTEAPTTQSRLIPTAYNLIAFSNYYNKGVSLDSNLTNAVNWIIARQKSDGGFAEDPSATTGNAYATAVAYLALAEAKKSGVPAAVNTQALMDSAISFLVTKQQTDGSWGGDPFTTALALQTLPAVTLADTDKDGMPDAVEALLGTNPLVADSVGLTGNGAGTTGVTTATLLASTAINQPFSITLTPPSGGTAPYTWSIVSGSLPDGLSLNSSTGVINGTPVNAGTFSFIYKVIDSTGSSATVAGQIVVVSDTTRPAGTITINAGASYTNSTAVTLTLFATDESGAVSQMQFNNDNASWSTSEAYATGKAWTLVSGDGTKTVYARFRDTAGNWSTAVSATIVLDTTKPAMPVITSPSGGAVLNTATITLFGTAEASTTVKVYDGVSLLGSALTNTSGAWRYTTAALTNGDHSFSVTATDAATNVSLASAAVAVTINVNVPPIATSGVSAIAAGGFHSVALKTGGSVAAWGAGGSGQTGFPHYGQSSVPVIAASGVIAIAAGTYHTVALKADGSVTAWGDNSAGQTSVPAAASSDVSAIAAGYAHMVALKSNGSVVAWGYNNAGQTTVPVTASSNVVAVAAGTYHTVALKSDGSVAAWGDNSVGQTDVPTSALSGVTAIAAGGFHTVALKSDGSVVAWGDKSVGQTVVPTAALSGVVAVAAGTYHTIALKANGSVIAWGNNSAGQTSVPSTALSGIIAVASGTYHSMALKSNGSVVAWGGNDYGQSAGYFITGLTSSEAQSYYGLPLTFTATVIGSNPTGTVSFKEGPTILGTATLAGGVATFSTSALSAGTHSITAAYSGDVSNIPSVSEAITQMVNVVDDNTPDPFCFAPQIGVAPGMVATSNAITVSGMSSPAPISIAGGEYSINGGAYTSVPGIVSNGQTVKVRQISPSARSTTGTATLTIGGVSGTFSVTTSAIVAPSYVAVDAGTYHTVALTSGGSVVEWGNKYTTHAAATSGVVAIAAGDSATVALKDNGSVIAWGGGSIGYLPVPTAASSGVVAISVGYDHAVALKSDGSVVAWGNNNYGQTNVPASALSGVIAVAAGDYHTVALKSNGSVVAWGYNSVGQTTVPAAASSGVVAIAAGAGHTVALKADSSLVAWGWNAYGQTTVPAAASSGVIAIAAGGAFTVALKSNGSVVAWGANDQGQSTVPATASSGVIAVAAGTAHTVALKSDGSVVAWGWNNYGQSADSSITIVASSAIPSAYGSPVTFTATVLGSSPSGTVTFKDGTTVLGTAPVVGGTATLMTSELSIGDHFITASYSGDTNYVSSVSAVLSQSIVLIDDIIPDPFNFIPQTGVAVSTMVTSNTIAVSGIDMASPIRITGGEYSINGGAYTSALGTVTNGQTITVRLTSSEKPSTSIGATVNIGGVSGVNSTFNATTTTGAPAKFVAVAAGGNHTVALKSDGSVGAWGDNYFGQSTVPAAALSSCIAIAAGWSHTIALKFDGSVMTWGLNSDQATVPAAASSGIIAINAGGNHTVALKANGSVVAWGTNGSGESTVPLTASSGVSAVAAGYVHTVALKSDSSVIAWGNNTYGQTTVPAAASSGVIAIAAGDYHTTALKTNGSVVAWGNNTYGQTTVPAAASSGVIAIAAGGYHTVALKSDGSVVAWGNNTYGQTTVPAAALSGVIAIAAGMYHTVALKSDGSIVAWGSNQWSESADTTVTTVVSSAASVTYGSTVTFTATVTGSSPTGTVTFKDGITTLGTVTLSGGSAAFSTSTLSAGAHAITAVYSGDTNNIASTSSPFIQVVTDSTLPTGSIAINNGAISTHSASATLTLSCSDSSGCAQMQFSNDNVSWSAAETFTVIKSWALTAGDGTKTVYAKFKDTFGNWSPVYNDTIIVDTTAPITTASVVGGIYNAPQSVSLRCSDGSGAGCNKIYFTTDGTNPTISSNVYAAPIDINAATTLKYFATDLAGNIETVKNQMYTIDTTPPTAVMVINYSGATYVTSTAVVLALSCTDANGCSQMQFSNDNVSWSTVEAYATSKAWTMTTGDGTKTVYTKFKDGAGNWSTAYGATIILDATAPDAPIISTPAFGTVQNNATVAFSGTAEASGTVKMYDGAILLGSTAASGSGSWNYTTGSLTEGSHSFTATVTDAAGNTGHASVGVNVSIDTTTPTGTIGINGGEAYATTTGVSLVFNCNDNGSGCSHMQISNDNVNWSTEEAYTTSTAWTLAAGDGNKTVYVKFKDAAGNWSIVYNATIILDTVMPAAPVIASPVGGVVQRTDTVTLSGTAETFSTVKIYDGATLLGGVTVTDGTWSYTATSLSNGSHSFAVTATDAAGNTSDVSIAVAVRIDTTAAITTALPGTSAFNSALSVELTCADGGGSGCDKIYYTLNGTTPSTSAAVYSAPISVSSTTTLKYFATDLAGNSETVQSQTYTLDTTKPTGTIVINSGATTTNSTNVTLSLTCTDANGCSQMVFSNDNISWSSAEAYAVGKAWTLTGGDGTKTVYVKFKDTADNWSAVYSDTISLKTYDLTITAVSGPTTGNITQQISVSYTVKNQGGSSVGSFNAGIYLSTDATVSIDDTFLGYDTVTSLGVGSQTTRSKSVRIPANMTAGTYYIGVIADYGSLIAETNESNNARSGNQIAITSVPPDLAITAVSGPASANVTQQVTISTTVKNLGGTTGGFNVSVYLSTDAAIDASDAFLGTVSVGTLSAGAQSISNPVVRIPASVPVGTYYVLALADSGNVITETNEGNNTLAGNLIAIAADIPDLTVSTVSCPTNANITEPVTVSTTVKNLGGITNAFSVNIYLSADTVITTSDRLLGTISVTGIIPAGGEIPLTATFRLSSSTPAGTYYVGAMADSGGVITEISEANNTLAGNLITTTAQRPDLIITTVAGPTGANITELATVSTAVKNLGGTTGNFSVNIYLSTDAVISTSDKLLGTISVPGALLMNGEIPLTASLRIPTSVTAGIYTLGAVVDPSNQIAELSDTNNALAGNSMVTTATYPDLIVTTVAGPATGIKGQPIAVSSAVKNQGGTTGGFSVGIYLSTDATITTNDTRIGTYNVDSIAGGTELQGGNSFTIPATLTSGTYYIGAFADYTKVASETNEANNALAGNKITISP